MIEQFIRSKLRPGEDIKDPEVRERIGAMAGKVGIATNLLLSFAKIALGLLFGSVSITADGMNNLSDATASIVTLVGFKMSAKDPDKEHPFGHGRTEYVSGLVVSIIIILVGAGLFRTSVEKIISPKPMTFSWLSAVVLILSILIKAWQFIFYKKAGGLIGSEALIATSFDSRNDVLSTSAVLLAVIGTRLFSFNLDGPMGIVVALFIIWSGIGLVKDTMEPILGKAPSKETVDEISDIILSSDGILGIHDLLVHDYGPGKLFASVDAEVDGNRNIFDIHDEIDSIEAKVKEKTGINLSIHMDPVAVGDPLTGLVKKQVEEVLGSIEGILDHHDVRVKRENGKVYISLDVVRGESCPFAKEELPTIIDEKMKEKDKEYEVSVIVDQGFV